MKIVIAYNWTDKGLPAQAKELALHLSRNHQVLFFSHLQSGTTNFKVNNNLEVQEWPEGRTNSWPAIKMAYRKMKAFKPDIAIGNMGAASTIALTAWLLQVPCRIEFYHTLYQQLFIDLRQPNWIFQLKVLRKSLLYRLNNFVVASNRYGINDLQEYYGLPAKMCRHINNGLVAMAAPEEAKGNDYLLYLGRLEKSKGIMLLLQAFALLRKTNPAAKLIVAGNGSLAPAVEAASRKAELKDWLQYLPAQPYEALPALIAGAQALVVPSTIDNHPTVIMEAYSLGTPVVGSANGGIPEMIEDGITGKVFLQQTPEALAQCLAELLADPEKLVQMRAEAKRRFYSEYNMPVFISKMEALMAELYSASTGRQAGIEALTA
jgi:glycosyltransferase involved in cell wall biosynthesis